MVIGTPFKPGQSGNPGGRPKTKPFKEAIRRAVEAAGDDTGKLDMLALALYSKALEGDVSALKEIADRLDGKVPQGIIGGDDDDPAVKVINRIERMIVHPQDRDS